MDEDITMSRPRSQPEGEIGPNNAGKMIVRSICYGFDLDNYPDLKTKVVDFVKARGTVADIQLPPKHQVRAESKLNPAEIKTLETMIEKFKALEFDEKEIKTKTAAQVGKQRDRVVELAYELLADIKIELQRQGIECIIEKEGSVITYNVSCRDPVDYKATLNWEYTDDHDLEAESDMVSEGGYVPPISGTASIFAGLTIHHHPSADATETFESDLKASEKKETFDLFQGLTIKVQDQDKVSDAEEQNVEHKTPRSRKG